MQKKILLPIAGGFVVLIAITGFVYYESNHAFKYSAANTPNDVLTQANADYAQAKILAKAGNYQGAIQTYQTALSKASDPIQKAQIQFNIASQKDHQGDYVGAVHLFKQLADDTNNITFLRAYAVQWMADINNNGDPAVTKEIFSTPPYSGMVVANDVPLTNRHLAEYASSIYPLGLTEMYIAMWYGEQLAASSTSPQAPSYVSIIKQKIANAEKDIERTKNDSAASGNIPDIIQFEARVKGNLAIAGAGSASDADAAFQRAFAAMTTYGMPAWYDEYTRLNYGIFLMRMYGKSRVADIHATLSPIYTSTTYKNAPIVTSLTNIANGGPVDPHKKHYIGQLANYDSGFRTYLLSLGWKKTDFNK